LRPTAVLSELSGVVWESLAPERLAYADLLLAAGKPADAHRIASTFDHPEILVNELFLLKSLEIRQRAASALGDTLLARQSRQRIASLRSSIP
jgi:hypothetical protein